MTVYVDQERTDGWCHLWADTPEELHRMADLIGLQRAWFQDRHNFPHYDLRGTKRHAALTAGAVEATLRDALRVMGHPDRVNLLALAAPFNKAAGQPATAYQMKIAQRVLHRLATAFPHWKEQDYLRVARMALVENEGDPVRLGSLTPKNAQRLYGLAVETKDGEYYDPYESPAVGQLFHSLMRKKKARG